MSEISWVERYRIAGELLFRTHELIDCGSMSMEYDHKLNGFVFRWRSDEGTKQAEFVASVRELDRFRGSLSQFALLIAKTMNEGSVSKRDPSMTERTDA